MANQFTETKTTGYGSRIINSIKGVVTGIVLFVASFGLLYWNEGRVDVSEVAKNSVEIKADQVDAGVSGKFVSLSGKVVSEETLTDGLYLVAGDYLAVERNVEMYAWVEKEESKSDTNTGGSETTTTTYTYVKDWTSSPEASSNFKYPQDHTNPVKTLENQEAVVTAAKLGAYNLDMSKLELPSMEKVTLNDQNVTLGTPTTDGKTPKLDGGYVFIGKGSLGTPEIGDLRVSYYVLKNNMEGTVFGKIDGDKVVTYVDEKTDTSLYRLFDGTRDEALATMHGEYKMMLWIFRLVGFLMMWFGLAALFGPISTFLDVLPVFGALSRGIVGVITFVAALVLSAVTIIVSMIIHNIVALIIAIVVVVILGVYIMKRKGNKPKVVQA